MLKIGHLILPTEELLGSSHAELESLGVAVYPVSAIGFSDLQAYRWTGPKPGLIAFGEEGVMTAYLKKQQVGSSLMALELTSAREQTLSPDSVNSFFYVRLRAGLDGAPVLGALAQLLKPKAIHSLDQDSNQLLFRSPPQSEFRLMQTVVTSGRASVTASQQEAILQSTYAAYMLATNCSTPDEARMLFEGALRLMGVLVGVAFIVRH